MTQEPIKQKCTFLTLTNDGYIDYTLNCLQSLKKIGCSEPLVCYTIGDLAFQALHNAKANVVALHNENKKNAQFQVFRTEQWADVVSRKFEIIYQNLLLAEFVCFTDGDIVYEKNGFLDFCLAHIKNNDMLIQNDSMSDLSSANLCSGFMFIKSNPVTLKLFNPVNIKSLIKEGWGDQLYINSIKNTLKFQTLPLALFPNGKYFYEHAATIRPFLIHFNWVQGHVKKEKMQFYNKWFLEVFTNGKGLHANGSHNHGSHAHGSHSGLPAAKLWGGGGKTSVTNSPLAPISIFVKPLKFMKINRVA